MFKLLCQLCKRNRRRAFFAPKIVCSTGTGAVTLKICDSCEDAFGEVNRIKNRIETSEDKESKWQDRSNT